MTDRPDPYQLPETAGPIVLEPASRWPVLVAVLIVVAAAVFVAQVASDSAATSEVLAVPSTDGSGQSAASLVPEVPRAKSAPAALALTYGTPEAATGLDQPVAVLPDTATGVTGTASWYCGGGSACTRGYPPGTLAAAAGPALRVGDWRGRIVKVCAGKRCVRVILADFCACPRRVIDLYRAAFARLAPPSRGVLRVTVTWGGSAGSGLPQTDTSR